MRQKVGLQLQCALQYDSSGVKAARAMALNGSDIDMMAEGNWPMRIQQLTALSAATLALSTLPSIAGPCAQAIDQMQGANAMAVAKGTLGEISSQAVETVAAAVAAFRAADLAGDQSGCEQALADARRALGGH